MLLFLGLRIPQLRTKQYTLLRHSFAISRHAALTNEHEDAVISDMHSHRIALLLGQELGYCRGVLSGILDYAEQKRLDWVFRDGPPTPRFVESLQNWKPDGIIAHIFDRSFALSLQNFGVPIVNVTLTIGELPFPVVDVDHEKVGAQAANYLIQKGFHAFAYFGSSQAMFSRAREKGFQNRLEAHNYEVSVLHTGFEQDTPWNIDWKEFENSVSEWVNKLEKPVAILASNDLPGRHLAAICRQLGYRIPQDIAILGADNDDSECRMTTPSLSSIALPTRAIGYKAGEILNAAILSETVPGAEHHLLPPVGIVERQSTEYASVSNPALERILKWIESHLQEPIGVEKIAKQNGLSRRSLERIVQKELGTSVHQLLLHRRLEFSKSLLRNTEHSLSQISEKSGFPSQRAFNHAFLRYEHMAPTTYRKVAKD